MARINLLPWRVERRKQREREFYVMLGFSTLVGILVSALVSGFIMTRRSVVRMIATHSWFPR